jgi:HK97 family phage portal protein
MPLTNDMIRTRTSQLAEKTVRPVRVGVRERSYSEETITPEISLTVSAVLAAFTILSEDLSSLPLILYQRRGRNKFRAYDSIYYRLMHDQPNPEHTSMIFREFMVGHMLGWGNFFGQPIFDKSGDVVELWPLRPDRMTVKRFEGERIYIYRTSEGKERVFLSEEILHIPAFGFDGLIGYSRIALARNAIGFTISTDKFGSKFFSNGANPGIIYKHPSELSDTAYDHLKESLDERAGVDQSHRPIILEEGMSIERLGLPNDDSQFLETRKFQVSEIARIFRVPPHMIGDVERSTSWGSGIDSQEQGYVNHTLRPWATRIDQQLNSKLLLEQDRSTYYYEHLMEGLLRGDIATRYAAYVSAINTGFISRNEARERENMNPRKGLDAMLMPLNMTTVTQTTTGGGSDVEGSDTEDTDSATASALEPLWRDAIARVLKREANDLSGASKRWQVKGQQEAYAEWIDQFYGVDHVAFMRKQFEPLVEAQRRLFDVDGAMQADVFIQEFLDERCMQVKSMSAEQLSDGMETYLARAAEEILSFVSGTFSIARIGNEEEFDYEQ